jgi:hypothetical protein
MRNGAALLRNKINEGNLPVNSSILAHYDVSDNSNWNGSVWTDLSGNGNHLLQNGAIALPTYSATEFSNNGGLVFNTASLKTVDNNLINSLNGLSGCTIFYVCKNIDVTTNQGVLIHGGSRLEISDDEDGNQSSYSIATHPTMSRRYEASLQETELVRMIMVDGTSGVSDDSFSGDVGVSQNVTGNLSMLSAPFSIGSKIDGTALCPCVFAEIIIYGLALSSSEISTMNTYLCDKWSISNLTPTADAVATPKQVYTNNLASSATFTGTVTHGSLLHLNDNTDNYWQAYLASNPYIEAEWSSSQTISMVRLFSFDTNLSTLSQPPGSNYVEIYWWNGSSWVSTGTHNHYGSALEVRFNPALNTNKLRFEVEWPNPSSNAVYREIQVF